MSRRLAAALAGIVLAVGCAPLASGDPLAPPPPGPASVEALPVVNATPPPAGPEAVPVASATMPGPPLDTGAVPSEPPVTAETLDGRTITVAARDET